jgi:hypothetical protein
LHLWKKSSASHSTVTPGRRQLAIWPIVPKIRLPNNFAYKVGEIAMFSLEKKWSVVAFVARPQRGCRWPEVRHEIQV